MPITDRLLSNGFRFVAEPIATTNTVAIGFWFSGGSRDESESEAGVTHFIEHLLFKGTASRSAYDIARFFDRTGGYCNAFTDRDLVCLYCAVPSAFAEEATRVLIDMVDNPLLAEGDIERERTVIQSEILASLDDSEECAMDAALGAVFGDHPFARPIAGSLESVGALTADALRDFHSKRFRRAPILVTVAGKFSPETLSSILETSLPALELPAVASTIAPPSLSPGFFPMKSPFSQTQLLLAYPVPVLSTAEEWFSWACINAIIGDTVSSRLFQSLREARGLCYSVYCFLSHNRDHAFWAAYLAIPPELTETSVEALLAEIRSVAVGGVTAKELEDARSHLSGDMLITAEDTENRMKRLGRQVLYNGRALSVEESLGVLSGIGMERVVGDIAATFRGASAALVVYGPKRYLGGCRQRWKL
jgi:predicted Zn-dependent peptidase